MPFEVRSKRRPAVVAALEPAEPVKVLASGWQGAPWTADINWPSWKDSSNSRWESQERSAKSAQQEERVFEGTEEITVQEVKNLWNRIRSRKWNAVLQEAYRYDIESCSSQHFQFKTAQLLVDLVHDVEGKSHEGFSCWERIRSLGTSPGTSRFVQAQMNISSWKHHARSGK